MTNLFSCGHPHKYFNCILLSRSVCLFLSLQCKLEQQACLTGKDLSVMCSGFCPCSTASVSITNADTKHGKCLFFTSFVFVHFNFGSQHHRCESIIQKRKVMMHCWPHTHSSLWIGLAEQLSPMLAQYLASILTNFRDYC